MMNADSVDLGGNRESFGGSPLLFRLLVVVLFMLGLGVRLVDLTDPPFDFHPTRQLLNAVIARGMYYEMATSADPVLRSRAISLWQRAESYEPPILERIVAITYLVSGGEHLWISRIYTSVFWLLGGVALLLLGLRLSNRAGVVVALVFYLFVPFSIQSSRSFQVDPMMVMAVLWSAWGLYRWGETARWRWAIVAGVFCGLTILIKVTAAYVLIGMALAVVLSRFDLRKAFRDLRAGALPQIGTVMLLAGLPPALYYVVGTRGGSSSYFDFWTISFLHLLLTRSFYGDLVKMINSLFGLPALFGALAGVCLMRKAGRNFLLGFWAGYILYMASFPYQITTHDYYHLQLIPLVALSLMPWGEIVSRSLNAIGRFWRLALIGVFLLGCSYPVWLQVRIMQTRNYQGEAGGWESIGRQLPQDGLTIGLVHDYGFPLAYYGWQAVKIWPSLTDLELPVIRGGNTSTDFEATFQQQTQGCSYFLVTLFNELDGQPQLKAELDRHPVVHNGDGYVLYDLRKVKS